MPPQENNYPQELYAEYLLKNFAKKNGYQLDHLSPDLTAPNWQFFLLFTPRGKVGVSTHETEMLLRTDSFAEIEYSPKVYLQILTLCLKFNRENRYLKLDYSVSPKPTILIFLRVELLNPTEDWLTRTLVGLWLSIVEVRNELKKIKEQSPQPYQNM